MARTKHLFDSELPSQDEWLCVDLQENSEINLNQSESENETTRKQLPSKPTEIDSLPNNTESNTHKYLI